MFSYEKNSGKELTGWLYRCVAGVELNLTQVPEDDPAQGILAFYRNHYYRIKGTFQDLISQNALLSVTVNPDWEGDADLSLDGK